MGVPRLEENASPQDPTVCLVRVLRGSLEGGYFLMGEAPMYDTTAGASIPLYEGGGVPVDCLAGRASWTQ